MKKLHALLLFGLLFTVFSANGQDDSTEIVFDRPGIADSPYIVALQNWQIEGGTIYVKEGKWEDLWYSSIMLRKSLHKRFEVRFTIAHQPTSALLDEFYDELAERYPVSIFGKWKIVDEKNWIPDMAFLGGLVVPIQKDFETKNLGYELYLMCQNNVNSLFSINYGGGVIKAHPQANLLYSYSACLNINAYQRLAFFVENYAYIQDKDSWERGFDAGVVFMPSPKSQIDISAGYHFLNENKNWYFVSLGYSHAIFRQKRLQTSLLH